ncbi:MAG TPA: hypothetical protein VFY66_09010 [Anaerolineales bacterium]|nr:hypothetical protein [Anaerolineales bacterium]
MNKQYRTNNMLLSLTLLMLVALVLSACAPAAFIASAPILIFYAIFQRKIIAGITTTGMAGQ